MKVLLAAPHLRGGGLERYANTMARELARAGHEVTLLGHSPFASDTTAGGLRVVGVVPQARVSNTPLGLGIARKAREILRETRPDVVDVHTPVPGTAELVAWVATRERTPFALTYHAGRLEGPGLLHAAAWLHRVSGERWLIGRASVRIGVSPYVAQNVFAGLPSLVIPPGVDAERFRAVARAVPGRILFVGPVDRSYSWKGFDVLWRAFERLAAQVPEATLRVVGKGDLLSSYARRAREAGLAHRVSFSSGIGDDELVREYSLARLLVLPSTTPAESFGMVLAEANACSRAVVASAVGGIPGFVRHEENGLLVPPGDAAALDAALRRLLADDELASRLGREGRARVVREHKWSDLAMRTADALSGACAPVA